MNSTVAYLMMMAGRFRRNLSDAHVRDYAQYGLHRGMSLPTQERYLRIATDCAGQFRIVEEEGARKTAVAAQQIEALMMGMRSLRSG